ncbi:uncharacterized protein BDV14DRAFT_157096 [Aspergillus stella-maris]|uniref:uncharacterized protein n=1 Tax=Aspergillus stella-maris TaxID=1810926 RepID=UPI003CCCCB7A
MRLRGRSGCLCATSIREHPGNSAYNVCLGPPGCFGTIVLQSLTQAVCFASSCTTSIASVNETDLQNPHSGPSAKKQVRRCETLLQTGLAIPSSSV